MFALLVQKAMIRLFLITSAGRNTTTSSRMCRLAMHGWRWPLVRWDGWAGGGREQKSEEDELTTKTEATNKTINTGSFRIGCKIKHVLRQQLHIPKSHEVPQETSNNIWTSLFCKASLSPSRIPKRKSIRRRRRC